MDIFELEAAIVEARAQLRKAQSEFDVAYTKREKAQAALRRAQDARDDARLAAIALLDKPYA